jgi:hypothetical protein
VKVARFDPTRDLIVVDAQVWGLAVARNER